MVMNGPCCRSARLGVVGTSEELADRQGVMQEELVRRSEATQEELGRVSKELADALRTIGFVVICGHGIDPAHHAEAHLRVERLFSSGQMPVLISTTTLAVWNCGSMMCAVYLAPIRFSTYHSQSA